MIFGFHLIVKNKNAILESFIIGTEPYNKNIRTLDDLGSINNNKIDDFIVNNHKVLVINNIEYGKFEGFNLKFNKDVISHSLF